MTTSYFQHVPDASPLEWSGRHRMLDLTCSNACSIVVGVETPKTLEHWFNGLWGTMNRRDIYLRINSAGPLWEIEARQAGQVAFGEYASEAQARRMLDEIVSSGPGSWRQLPL
jgi:hypothetical protein